MLKKSLYLTVLLSIFVNKSPFCQTPDFTQVSTNLLYSNPAFAGAIICPKLYLEYRNRFLSLGSAYQTFYGSYDQYLHQVSGDIGIVLIHDRQAKGYIKNTQLGLIYAKEIPLSKKMNFKLGVETDYFLHSASNKELSYPDQIDPFYGYIYNSNEEYFTYSTHKINVSAGLLLYNERFFAGISMYNINQPKSPNYKKSFLLLREYIAHGGAKFNLSKSPKVKSDITTIIQLQLENPYTLGIIGANLRVNQLVLGLWNKQNFTLKNESFSILIGFVEKKYKFAYNCDMSFSGASSKKIDSHEVSFTYYFNCIDFKRKIRAIRCPGF